MKTIHVPAGHYVHLAYRPQRADYARVRVSATQPVRVCVLDEAAQRRIDAGEQRLPAGHAQRQHEFVAAVPTGPRWYVAVDNGTAWPADADVDVFV